MGPGQQRPRPSSCAGLWRGSPRLPAAGGRTLCPWRPRVAPGSDGDRPRVGHGGRHGPADGQVRVYVDVFDDAIVAQGRQELDRDHFIANPRLMKDKTWAWCVQELRDKAVYYRDHQHIQVLDTGSCVCKADSAELQSLSALFRGAVASLAHQYKANQERQERREQREESQIIHQFGQGADRGADTGPDVGWQPRAAGPDVGWQPQAAAGPDVGRQPQADDHAQSLPIRRLLPLHHAAPRFHGGMARGIVECHFLRASPYQPT